MSTCHGLEKTVDTPNVMASSAIVPKDAISVVPQVEILSPASGEAVGFDDDIAETKVIVQLVGLGVGHRNEWGTKGGGKE